MPKRRTLVVYPIVPTSRFRRLLCHASKHSVRGSTSPKIDSDHAANVGAASSQHKTRRLVSVGRSDH